MRGAGCVKSIIGYYPYEAKSYRPREGCGLRRTSRAMIITRRAMMVTVPVRGAGCVRDELLQGRLLKGVTVPVRGAGCVPLPSNEFSGIS